MNHKQLKAKMKIDRRNKLYFMVAGVRRAYMRDKWHFKMFDMDFLSGKFSYHGPRERLP